MKWGKREGDGASRGTSGGVGCAYVGKGHVRDLEVAGSLDSLLDHFFAAFLDISCARHIGGGRRREGERMRMQVRIQDSARGPSGRAGDPMVALCRQAAGRSSGRKECIVTHSEGIVTAEEHIATCRATSWTSEGSPRTIRGAVSPPEMIENQRLARSAAAAAWLRRGGCACV